MIIIVFILGGDESVKHRTSAHCDLSGNSKGKIFYIRNRYVATHALLKTQGRGSLKRVILNKTNETGFNSEFLLAADN